MVTLQILVLPFLVRVRVPQQKNRQVIDFNDLAILFFINYFFLMTSCSLVYFESMSKIWRRSA